MPDYYAVQTGNWTSPATWAGTSGGAPGSGSGVGYPDADDDNAFVDAASGAITITADAEINVTQLDIAAGASSGFILDLRGFPLTAENFRHRVGTILVDQDSDIDCAGGECYLPPTFTPDNPANAPSMSCAHLRYYATSASIPTLDVVNVNTSLTLRPQATETNWDLDIDSHLQCTDGASIIFDGTDSSTFLSLEIKNQGATRSDIVGAGVSIANCGQLQHENNSEVNTTNLNGTVVVDFTAGAASVYDCTGRNVSTGEPGKYAIATANLDFSLSTNPPVISLEKHVQLSGNGFGMVGCHDFRIGTVNPAHLLVGSGTFSGNGFIRLRGTTASHIDLGTGALIGAEYFLADLGGGYLTTDTGYLLVTGTDLPAGTDVFFHDTLGSGAGDGSAGNPYQTFQQMLDAGALLPSGARCVFNLGGTFTIPDGVTITGLGYFGGRAGWGSGAPPIFQLESGAQVNFGASSSTWRMYNARIQGVVTEVIDYRGIGVTAGVANSAAVTSGAAGSVAVVAGA